MVVGDQEQADIEPILLSSDQVADMLYVSIRTVWRMVKRGTIPQPIRFSRKTVRWRKSDIVKLVEETK